MDDEEEEEEEDDDGDEASSASCKILKASPHKPALPSHLIIISVGSGPAALFCYQHDNHHQIPPNSSPIFYPPVLTSKALVKCPKLLSISRHDNKLPSPIDDRGDQDSIPLYYQHKGKSESSIHRHHSPSYLFKTIARL